MVTLLFYLTCLITCFLICNNNNNNNNNNVFAESHYRIVPVVYLLTPRSLECTFHIFISSSTLLTKGSLKCHIIYRTFLCGFRSHFGFCLQLFISFLFTFNSLSILHTNRFLFSSHPQSCFCYGVPSLTLWRRNFL